MAVVAGFGGTQAHRGPRPAIGPGRDIARSIEDQGAHSNLTVNAAWYRAGTGPKATWSIGPLGRREVRLGRPHDSCRGHSAGERTPGPPGPVATRAGGRTRQPARSRRQSGQGADRKVRRESATKRSGGGPKSPPRIGGERSGADRKVRGGPAGSRAGGALLNFFLPDLSTRLISSLDVAY